MESGKTEKDEFGKSNQSLRAAENFQINNYSCTNPFVNESYSNFTSKRCTKTSNATSTISKETNNLFEQSNNVSVHFSQPKLDELPELTKSLFEVEEPELIKIFTKPLPLKPSFKNPFKDDFVSYPCVKSRNSTNPFEEVGDMELCKGISGSNRTSRLDSSEWHKLDEIFQKAFSSQLH